MVRNGRAENKNALLPTIAAGQIDSHRPRVSVPLIENLRGFGVVWVVAQLQPPTSLCGRETLVRDRRGFGLDAQC